MHECEALKEAACGLLGLVADEGGDGEAGTRSVNLFAAHESSTSPYVSQFFGSPGQASALMTCSGR